MTVTDVLRRLDLAGLAELEDESIHVLREAAGQFDRPVLLARQTGESVVLLELARKAFWPASVGSHVLHVGTGPGCQAGAVKALRDGRFDAVIVDSRREAASCWAPSSVFSVRDAARGVREGDLGVRDGELATAERGRRPEFWGLYNGRRRTGEQLQVAPLADWTELDIRVYLDRVGRAEYRSGSAESDQQRLGLEESGPEKSDQQGMGLEQKWVRLDGSVQERVAR